MSPQLSRGVRIVNGYVQARLSHDGLTHCKNFGKDCQLARQLAEVYVAERRKEILMGKAGITPELPSKRFSEVAELYYAIWSVERDPEGRPKHSPTSVAGVRSWLDNIFIPAFGREHYESIRPIDVQRWRDGRVSEVMGTTANREQSVLSSVFSHVEAWVKSGKVKPFKIPAENPCRFIEKAKIQVRERVLSSSELSVLKAACLSDPDLWEICKMALKSLLRKKDLMRLESGLSIDMEQAKTGIRVNLPVQVLRPLNYTNFRKRWEAVRRSAGLEDVQFRDLRKTGANLLKMKNVSNKLISEFLGHASTRTTELYMVKNTEHLKPLADELAAIVEGL